MHEYGGDRDYTKFQIGFQKSPSVHDPVCIYCYHCSDPIVKENDPRYVMVAGAHQRPIYLHDKDCYEEFLHGLVVFYKEILCPQLAAEEAL